MNVEGRSGGMCQLRNFTCIKLNDRFLLHVTFAGRMPEWVKTAALRHSQKSAFRQPIRLIQVFTELK